MIADARAHDSTDVVCFCTNTDFQASALACFQSQCTPEEAEAATALQAQQCGAAGK